MGTECCTAIKDHGEVIACLWRHYDGYPQVHGKELIDFLKGFKIVNGIRGNDGKVANGMECLAAQLVAHFKQGVGDFYLNNFYDSPEEVPYVYEVYLKNRGLYLDIYEYGKKIKTKKLSAKKS